MMVLSTQMYACVRILKGVDILNRNEFIILTAAESGVARYVNINHILYYYRWHHRTYIKLSTDKEIECKETCDEIDKLIDEVFEK